MQFFFSVSKNIERFLSKIVINKMFIAVFEAYRINRNTFKGESLKVGEQEKALRRSLSKSVKLLHTRHTYFA